MAAPRSRPCLKLNTNARWRGPMPRSRCLKPKSGTQGSLMAFGHSPASGRGRGNHGHAGPALRFDDRAAARVRTRHIRQHHTAGNLFQSGRTGPFHSVYHRGPFEPKHIGIAWDGSRLAARALRDAAPFLTRARNHHHRQRQREAEIAEEVSAATWRPSWRGAALPHESSV